MGDAPAMEVGPVAKRAERGHVDPAVLVRAPWPLTGRTETLERIRTALAVDGRAAVLVGRAGLGRTRLADEAPRSLARTHVVLRATATAAAATMPFGPLAGVVPGARPGADLAALEEAIVAAGRGRPVLLVIDDAHLLDDASAALLHHLVLRGSASALLTVLEGRPVPDAVTALWKDGHAERIDLEPLDRETVGALLATVVGPFEPLAERDLWELSGGAPLLLRELLLAAAEADAIVREESLWRIAVPVPISRRLIEIVDVQSAGLDDGARRCLHLLALADELGLGLLVDLVGGRAVADLEARDLLVVDQDGRRRPCRIAGPLLARVVRGKIPAAEADVLRHTLIDALENPGRRTTDRLRAAELRVDARLEPDPAVVLEAAQRAWFHNDFARAERLARAALDRTGGLDALSVLCDALFGMGRAEEIEALLSAVDPAVGTPQEHAVLTVMRSQNLFGNLHRPDEAMRLVADLTMGGAEFLALQANYLLLQGRPLDALALLDPALASGSAATHHQMAVVAGPSLALTGRTAEGIDIATRAYEHRVAQGDALHIVDTHSHLVALATAYTEAGRLADAEALAQRGHDASVVERSFDSRGFCALALGRVALVQGRPATATRLFSEAVLIYRDIAARGCLRWALGGLAFARALAGDVLGATSAIDALDRAPSTSFRMLESDIMRARAWTAHLERRPREARRLLLEAAAEAKATGQCSLEAAALHDLVRLGADDDVVARLVEVAGQIDGTLGAARAAHAVALAAQDADALDAVAATFEAMGAHLVATEAASEAARVHQEAGRTRAATRSAVHATQLHERCEGAHPGSLPWAPVVEPLTRREREIALLAAEGLSSPLIGERLTLSTRTVDNHLRRAYEKLGVSGRHELAAAMALW